MLLCSDFLCSAKGLSGEKTDREEIEEEIEILGKNLHTPKPRFNVAFTYLLIHNSTFLLPTS